jgi:carbamoyltransferase
MMAATLTAGVAGQSRYGSIALSSGHRVLGACEQQRVTRVRAAGCNQTGLPDEALDTMLERLGYTRSDVARYATADGDRHTLDGKTVDRLDHHMAHACASYLSSPFDSATIVVCDQESPKVSVWTGNGADVKPFEWTWDGPGFADIYSACAAVFGFGGNGGAQRLDALARLRPDHRDERVTALFSADESSLRVESGWEGRLEALVRASGRIPACAGLAAAVQSRIGELFTDWLAAVRRRTGAERLCLGGSFFYHSSVNTLARQSGLFADVFVPVDPGNPGLALGAAMHTSGSDPQALSPFLGPAYTATEIKATLDNCKLQYDWHSHESVVEIAVRALQKGTLVAWYEGAMEWGPRALGARSILASPFSPYVLENLNGFLKHREPWRGYALSALAHTVGTCFDGPGRAPFMECDYRPRDGKIFRDVLPTAEATIRVQSVDDQAPPRFRRLLEAFGAATGYPCLVNTSFNGFHEPIVCSPRDAVRVFYGSGIDMLVLDQFILTK